LPQLTTTAIDDDVHVEVTRGDQMAAVRDRQQDIEAIIKNSWASGFDAGASGRVDYTPTPIIDWAGTAPSVTGWSISAASRRVPGLAQETVRWVCPIEDCSETAQVVHPPVCTRHNVRMVRQSAKQP
jgi:hypothetical protein